MNSQQYIVVRLPAFCRQAPFDEVGQDKDIYAKHDQIPVKYARCRRSLPAMMVPGWFLWFFRSSQTSIDYRTHFHLNYLSDLASSGTLRLLGHINFVGLNISCTIAELAQKLHQDHVQVNMKLMKKSSQVLRSAGKSASRGLWRLHVWMLGGKWQKPGQKYGGFLHPRLVVSNIYRFMMIYDDSWLFNHTCNGRLRLGLGWKYQPRSWVCHGARGIRGRLALLETRFGVGFVRGDTMVDESTKYLFAALYRFLLPYIIIIICKYIW